MTRPRLLLVPLLTELEWDPIRAQLEEWADVASYDLPGVGEFAVARLGKVGQGVDGVAGDACTIRPKVLRCVGPTRARLPGFRDT